MTPEWAAEERRLWDKMMYTKHNVFDSRENLKILAAAKRQGKDLERVRKTHRMISPEEAVSRDWKAYRDWIVH